MNLLIFVCGSLCSQFLWVLHVHMKKHILHCQSTRLQYLRLIYALLSLIFSLLCFYWLFLLICLGLREVLILKSLITSTWLHFSLPCNCFCTSVAVMFAVFAYWLIYSSLWVVVFSHIMCYLKPLRVSFPSNNRTIPAFL